MNSFESLQGSGSISSSYEFEFEESSSDSGFPQYPPLSSSHSPPIPLSDFGGGHIDVVIEEAPDDSALSAVGRQLQNYAGDDISLGGQTIGIKDLKSNFKAAMKKDRDISSKPLRFLKRAARVSGLVLGITINLTAKVVAFAVAAALSPVVMVGYSVAALFSGTDSSLWKNPREALSIIFAGGLVCGAAAGAAIGGFGNLLIKTSLSMEYEKGDDIGSRLKEDFTQAFTDNVGAAAIGASIGTVASLVNPVLWRAAWVPDTSV